MTDIVALAIHDLNREDAKYSVKLSGKLLDATKTTERVISTIYDLYNSRTSKSHGRFTTAEGSPTEAQIKSYIEAKEKDFLSLTGKMMDNLAREAGKKSASEGGHVFLRTSSAMAPISYS